MRLLRHWVPGTPRLDRGSGTADNAGTVYLAKSSPIGDVHQYTILFLLGDLICVSSSAQKNPFSFFPPLHLLCSAFTHQLCMTASSPDLDPDWQRTTTASLRATRLFESLLSPIWSHSESPTSPTGRGLAVPALRSPPLLYILYLL